MKRTTVWKLVASALLIAVTLPLFSMLAPTPVDGLDASSLVAPLPYAMEQYGQHHSDIYKGSAPVIDGKLDDSYTLLDSFDEGAGNFNGVFASSNQDGSGIGEWTEENLPDELTIYGSYNDEYVFLHIQTISRTTETGYSIVPKFGFTFSESQADAHIGTELDPIAITDAEGEKATEDYFISTESKADGDSTGSYFVNTTVYEFRVAWSTIAGELKPETDFDRMYFTLTMKFFDGTENSYWIYGVPNSVPLAGNFKVEDAWGDKASKDYAYTPNVINLKGEKTNEVAETTPEILSVERTDSNNEKERSFRVTYRLSKLSEIETGLLFFENTSSLEGKHLTLETENVQILPGELKEYNSENQTFTYEASFSTSVENYAEYFTLRPYVMRENDTVVYGSYYTYTPQYYDEDHKTKYDEYYKVLMVGCSFSGYYLDELCQLAASEGVHLSLGRIYSSGQRAHEHWDWLLLGDDYLDEGYTKDSHGIKFGLYTAEKPNGQFYKVGRNMYESIHYFSDWDIISVQDHYAADPFALENGYKAGLLSSMPYMPNLFHYLELNFPKTDLYIHQTWAYQVGYGYKNPVVENGNVVSGTLTKTEAQAMPSVEKQNAHHENIKNTCYTMSELTGVAIIPSGDAWALARAHELVGDVLCDGKKGDSNGGDYYHDGQDGGGQFLNALVWYEMITGRDCRNTTWVPTTKNNQYNLKVSADALREAAHQAVQEYKTTGSWLNNTSVAK